MPEKPNILEIRYIAVQYSKDVFIYLDRGRVSDSRLRSEARVETARWGVPFLSFISSQFF